ncbi:MAG: hypothetical protein HKN91_01780 [Acidimicrobiia bacterium]|nr:hypothetical protein [Acidimicrobiia bacterium]
MFEFVGSPVPVRPDLKYSYINTWLHFARPGPTLTGAERIELLTAVRGNAESSTASAWFGPAVAELARTLYSKPTAVNGSIVAAAAEEAGDPTTVEVIGLVSMLAAVDGTHRALGADLEGFPPPQPGDPTGVIAEGLKRRRTHIPVPPGPIPVVLDLLPDEGAAFQSLFGPQYMTGWEMAMNDFRRHPGLDRAQMEIVSSRTSMHNECFY